MTRKRFAICLRRVVETCQARETGVMQQFGGQIHVRAARATAEEIHLAPAPEHARGGGPEFRLPNSFDRDIGSPTGESRERCSTRDFDVVFDHAVIGTHEAARDPLASGGGQRR